ncbi:hypothetical protein G6038_23215 [Rhodococcus sp. 14C212]|uniref:hypothetical protein n=1 Tax=Rhodococcus sp. 14C212 TaxID=2711209 RepID=UPI0013EB4D53|nr:hypothetical protein [Rhodococcus sp. 14C212]NGP08331.1 hypothetical protein [Rhodococcus sp. 14C212]
MDEFPRGGWLGGPRMRRTLHQHNLIDEEDRTLVHDHDNPAATGGPRHGTRTLVGIDAAITARHHIAIRTDDQSTPTRFSA